MLAALKKPIRVISLDYDCLQTPIVVAESTLRLVNALLSLQAKQLSLSEKSLLAQYKGFLEGLIRQYVSVKKSGAIAANQKAIAKGLAKFKGSLSQQDFATLKLILKADESKALNIDVSDIAIKYHSKFLGDLRSENGKYLQTVVFVGSDRTSSYIDKLVAHNEDLLYKGHALQVIPHIAGMLGAHYDPLLLGNVFPGDGGRGVMDPDHILTLYYQSHRIALSHPVEAIEFQIYSKGSYSALMSSLKACPEMLAKAITLCLRQYEGSAVTQLLKTKAKGQADSHYVKTIAAVIESAPMQISAEAPVRAVTLGKSQADIKPAQLKHLLKEPELHRQPQPQTYNLLRQATTIKLRSSDGPAPGAH